MRWLLNKGQEIGAAGMVYVKWGENTVKLTWKPGIDYKDRIITSVHGICLLDGKVLLSHIHGRGFNAPGGHLENDETPEETLHREIYEEAYVRGIATYIGCIEVSHEENPDYNGKYPKVGYQAYYRVDITECLPFLREFEAKTRIWVEPSEVNQVVDDHEIILEIMEDALKIR